ncbi:1-deoxy-D-xylulose-5-phosphate reductoisomerase [Bacillus sp. RG28]|uniref:1-deoxy-D-xylulose 5-phosphate reductoisomerase n=1 Tax=Gottfriedia endophytica TaxID=2820819 RepID=A0A940NL28_9BACI|nr:1-deoxy-D-xylulose-5-phosphate reductoisomerase [Gottfriedia endophytica]MBP0726207.1 1-deoxy-D-xylulose-5-phosphate reductoisomerase [Gottfriedia endophytica]
MKKISLLGATGSIGTQTIDLIRNQPSDYQLVACSAGTRVEELVQIILEFKPQVVSVAGKEEAEKLKTFALPSETSVYYGEEGLIEVATHHESDIVVNAVMGSVGLTPTMKAIQCGKTIALANKETLVTAGHIVMAEAKKYGVSILPVDSEHSAIYQCLNGENYQNINKLIITASGGSFRDLTRNQLTNVTIEDALNHPNWSMGAKITIDSASMMNKGLEVIEAHWLFNMPYDQIDVILHRESVIHSMVEFIDGSVMAQLGTPDMRVPIAYALNYPDRKPIQNHTFLDLIKFGRLHFEEMDLNRFRCLKYAYDAGKAGGSMPTVLNAANEIAVSAFLHKRASFLQIEELIENALENHSIISNPTLEEIQLIDEETRKYVSSLIK